MIKHQGIPYHYVKTSNFVGLKRETKMIWKTANGRELEISKMATAHLENCLPYLDECIAGLTKSLSLSNEELTLKRSQKKAMLRELYNRRRSTGTCPSCGTRIEIYPVIQTRHTKESF